MYVYAKFLHFQLEIVGNVIRANKNLLTKINLNIQVDEKRIKAHSKQWWIDTLDGELRASRLHPNQTCDRRKWPIRFRRVASAIGTNKGQKKGKSEHSKHFFSNNVYFNNKILQYNTNYIFQIATLPVIASQTAFRNRIKRYSLIMTTIANVPKTVNTNYSFSYELQKEKIL